MVSDAVFWDRAADKYAKSPIKDMDAYEDTLRRTRAYLSPDARVLELGCGTSNTAVKLSGDVGHILATDISPKMIEIGQRRVRDAGVQNVDPTVGSVFDKGFDDQTFDVVLAFNFIHLLRDPQALIQRAYTRVKPGGVFISKSGCLKEWNGFMKAVVWLMQRIGKAPHVASFNAEELLEMHREAGFDIVETHIYSSSPPTPFIVARRPA